MDRDDMFTIGQLARLTGVDTRTIRFWSDEGIVEPTTRSGSGYRLYDAEAAARFDLVRTLRDLGLDLATIRSVVHRQCDLAAVAAAHARALDTEIRTLRVRRAVLRSIAERHTTTEEIRIMHELVSLSAAERQRLIDEFVDEAFAGIEPHAPGAGISTGMRSLPATLPDDPTPAQIDAWIELATLVGDPEFRSRCREMAVTGATGDANVPEVDLGVGATALADGIAPRSPEAAGILDRVIPPGTDRQQLADHLATFTDARVERYWALLGVLNDWPPRAPMVPGAQWIIDALRAGNSA